MKKLQKSFVFWGIVISLIIILLYHLGFDANASLLIGFNPILLFLQRNFLDSMNSGYQITNQTSNGSISIYWYLASVISFMIYGLLLEVIRKMLRKNKAS
ncbi:MAG: hypothetical protein FWE36_02945 [Erysipelotrichales bacterium]|nr:hypothetical protein [Erysipelotrichales bacterium]